MRATSSGQERGFLMVDTIIREAKEMKEIYYPRYVNEYRRLDETIIRLDRRCADGEKRFITYLEYGSKEDCDRAWEEECGA